MCNFEERLLEIPVPATKKGRNADITRVSAVLQNATAPNLRQNHSSMIPKNQKGEKKMPKIFVDFRPAEVVSKKETYVTFYVLNPYTQKLDRKRIRCNHIKGQKERLKYARLLCAEVNARLYEGWNPYFDAGGNVQMETALNKFLVEKSKEVRKDTKRVYVSIIGLFAKWCESKGLLHKPCILFTPRHAEQYMNTIADNPKTGNRSYNNYLRCLKSVFAYIHKRGYVAENPFENIATKKCDKKLRCIIPSDDRARIKEYFMANNPVFFICVLMCYRLFIRPKEMLMLKVNMYDSRENILHIPADIAKNHNERLLALPDELRDYFVTLQKYPSNWYIFSDKDTFKPGRILLDSKRVGRVWEQMRDKLKLPASYQFYSLKDTGITEMLEAGVPAKYVKELADHHSLEMTERYTHRSDAFKILEYNKLEF